MVWVGVQGVLHLARAYSRAGRRAWSMWSRAREFGRLGTPPLPRRAETRAVRPSRLERRAVVDLEPVADRVGEVGGVVAGPVRHVLRAAQRGAGVRDDRGEAIDLGPVGCPERDAVLVRREVRAL